MDEALLDKLRRGVPLRMRPTGALFFGEEPVTHPRIEAAIRAGLDITDRGEHQMYLGDQWCYLTVDDAPFRVVAVRARDDHFEVRLDDGRSVVLDPATLTEDEVRGLRCQVPAARSGRPMTARFTNRAQMDLAPHLVDAEEGTALRIGARRFPISSARAPAP